MSRIVFSDNVLLPKKLEYSINNNPKLGVCVIYKDNRINVWNSLQRTGSEFNKKAISTLLINDIYNDFANDFVVVNENGETCYSNCNASVAIDENGFIHINDDEYLVKPINDIKNPKYVGGRDIKAINRRTAKLIDDGKISTPKEFSKHGFTTLPIYQEQK